ncbi:MAG TPA: FHA domain-containing protein, partial [Bdellovibrio sp.]|nr:FHA domain-containing protein [Bdellovibrio sp.]
MSAAPNLKSTLKFEIEVSKGPHLGLRLDFTKGSATIGRGPENDIVLSNDPRVSRQHAEIKQRDDCFIVVNLSAKNFILVDGVNVQSEVIKSG